MPTTSTTTTAHTHWTAVLSLNGGFGAMFENWLEHFRLLKLKNMDLLLIMED